MKEDAPTNSVASGGVSMPADAVHDRNRKKKKIIKGLETQAKS